MTIREIELNNFRIYKGKNKIELFPDGNRNLIIVSGNNGFGKTTFLMSLVWCLYGKNMGKLTNYTVKKLTKKEVIVNTLVIVSILLHRKKAKLDSLCPLHLRM